MVQYWRLTAANSNVFNERLGHYKNENIYELLTEMFLQKLQMNTMILV